MPTNPTTTERCSSCGATTGLFLGDSDVCAGCEAERDLCTACGTCPRASDLLCAECEAVVDW